METIDQSLHKFNEKETAADAKCEDIYTRTTSRRVDCRYIVHLPFIQNPSQIGESKHMAHTRLQQLEIKLERSGDLQDLKLRDYKQRMGENIRIMT